MFICGFKSFPAAHMSTNDTERTGFPIESKTPEIINKTNDLVTSDRTIKMLVKAKTRLSASKVFSTVFPIDVQFSTFISCMGVVR